MLFALPRTQAESKINMIFIYPCARIGVGIFCLVSPCILISHSGTVYYITFKVCAYAGSNSGSRKIFPALYWTTASLAKWSDFSRILPLTFNDFYFGKATQGCKQIPSCANIFLTEAHTTQVHSQWYKHLAPSELSANSCTFCNPDFSEAKLQPLPKAVGFTAHL